MRLGSWQYSLACGEWFFRLNPHCSGSSRSSASIQALADRGICQEQVGDRHFRFYFGKLTRRMKYALPKKQTIKTHQSRSTCENKCKSTSGNLASEQSSKRGDHLEERDRDLPLVPPDVDALVEVRLQLFHEVQARRHLVLALG